MPSNPFSTRFIQPGAIPYHRFDGGSVADLANAFLAIPSGRGALVGPHGSGKSTLVASLVEEWKCLRPGLKIHAVRFSTDQSPSKALNATLRAWSQASLAVLDGYEQLKFWSRLKVAWVARNKAMRVLATAHHEVRGFETLWTTSVSDRSSQWVIEKLLQPPSASPSEFQQWVEQLLASQEWQRSRKKHDQNLRESLFDMYDWWHRTKTS